MKNIITHLSKDHKLKPIIFSGDIAKLTLSENICNDLIKSVVYQQLSTKAATTIFNRFLDIFPKREIDPQMMLKFEIESLRAVGLSKQKASYTKNISAYFIENNLFNQDWSNHSDDDIIRKLTEIKGVGVWTVQMILISSLAREDVFPDGDLGIQKSMGGLYNLDLESKDLRKKMIKLSEKWRPFRSYASLYLWRWLDK